MSSLFAALVLAIFVALAPRRVLGPVIGFLVRWVGSGVLAVACLGAAIYLFSNPAAAAHHAVGLVALVVGVACAAWWIYRRFVPVYRDQAPPPPSDFADGR